MLCSLWGYSDQSLLFVCAQMRNLREGEMRVGGNVQKVLVKLDESSSSGRATIPTQS